MDWTASGIRNSFRYELVDAFSLSRTGWLEGVTGGRITEAYNGDLRSSCTLDLDGCEVPDGSMVRVWHSAELDGETYLHALGTFIPESQPMDWERGRKRGTVSMQSALYRLSKDLRAGDRAIAAGTAVNSQFAAIVEAAGGTALLPSLFSALKTLSTAHVWANGESCLTELHRLASAMSPRGRVMPDSMGRVTCEPYSAPADRPTAWTLGGDSLIKGLSIETPEICNKVCCKATIDNADVYAVATVADSHPWAWSKLGYWATKHYTESDVSSASDLQAIADSYLSQNSDTARTFGATALYSPLEMGTAGTLIYRDSPDGAGIRADVWLSQREIQLDAAMLCDLTLEEVV